MTSHQTGPPIRGGAPKGPTGSSGHPTTPTSSNNTAIARRRRAASWRLSIPDSGRADPWHYDPPTAGYEEAAAHLLGAGLLPAPNREGLRLMWLRGGYNRHAAELIAQRWESAA